MRCVVLLDLTAGRKRVLLLTCAASPGPSHEAYEAHVSSQGLGTSPASVHRPASPPHAAPGGGDGAGGGVSLSCSSGTGDHMLSGRPA